MSFKKVLALLLVGSLFLRANIVNAASPATSSASINDVYVQPIPGLKTGFFGTISANQIREALVADNYRAYCAAKEFVAKPRFSGAIDRLEDLGLTATLSPEFGLGTSVEAVRIPLIKSEGSTGEIDFESYIANSVANSNYDFQKDITVGAIYKQLNQTDLCKLQIQTLKQIKRDCEQLKDPGTCTLYRPIEGTSFDTKTLLKAWNESDLTCEDFEKSEVWEKDKNREIRSALNKTPLFHEKYRLAFLVHVTRQREEKNLLERLFLRAIIGGSEINISEGDAISVVALLVPASFSKQEAINDRVNFHTLEEQQLFSLEDLEKQDKNYQAEKKDLASSIASAAKRGFSDKEIINCQNCDEGEDRHIKTALAYFINGSPDLSCANIRTETAQQIDTPGNVPNDSKQNYLSSGLNAYQTYVTSFLERIISTFESKTFVISSEEDTKNHDEKANFYTYLIVPYVEEISEFEALTTIQDQENIALLEKNLPTNTRLNSLDDDGSSKADRFSFLDPEKCSAEEYAAGSTACNNAVKANLGGNPLEDASLSVITRLFRRAGSLMSALLNPDGSREHSNAISTYNNNETFLLGSAYTSTNTTGNRPDDNDTRPAPAAECNPNTPGTVDLTTHENARHWVSGVGQVSQTDMGSHAGACTNFRVDLHAITTWNQSVNLPLSICDKISNSAACSYENTMLMNPVNSQGEFVTAASTNACEYVVKTLNQEKVNARLGLAVWLNASGGSVSGDDFGFNSAPSQDLAKQLAEFIKEIKAADSYEEFLLKYSEGLGKVSGDGFCTNPWLVGQLTATYERLGQLAN